MSDKKIREFWIDLFKHGPEKGKPCGVYEREAPNVPNIHVIEFSAFKAQQDKIQQLESRIEKLREALKFYVDYNNWTLESFHHAKIVGDEISTGIAIREDRKIMYHGGKKARQALMEDDGE